MISMTRRSVTRLRPVVDAAPRIHVVQTDTTTREGGVTALLESAMQEILAGTYWVDPAPHPRPYPVTGRFSRRRVDVEGRAPAWGRVCPGRAVRGGRPR